MEQVNEQLNTLRVIHTIAGLQASRGGTARSIPELCDSLATVGVLVRLLTQEFIGQTERNVLPRHENVHVTFAKAIHVPRLRAIFPISFRKKLEEAVREFMPDIIHDHGIWLPNNVISARLAEKHKIPLVLHPRGSLTDWALSFKSLKKKLARQLYQDHIFRQVALYVATSEQEAISLRNLGFKQPIAIIPNGISFARPVAKAILRASPVKTLLFLSRVHPIKGLELLIEAWDLVRPCGWRCVIAGPDEENTTSKLRTRIERLGLQDEFTFVGPADEAQKLELFANADLFVLPSFSENFGIVVLEAMANSLPCIATTGTPWEALATERMGWHVPATVAGIASALSLAEKCTDEERREMGRIAAVFARKNYSADAVGHKMKCAYEWLLGMGSKPEYVI